MVLNLIIGCFFIICGTILCCVGISAFRASRKSASNGTVDSSIGTIEQRLTRNEQRTEEAIRNAEQASQNIQDIINDIRKHPRGSDNL